MLVCSVCVCARVEDWLWTVLLRTSYLGVCWFNAGVIVRFLTMASIFLIHWLSTLVWNSFPKQIYVGFSAGSYAGTPCRHINTLRTTMIHKKIKWNKTNKTLSRKFVNTIWNHRPFFTTRCFRCDPRFNSGASPKTDQTWKQGNWQTTRWQNRSLHCNEGGPLLWVLSQNFHEAVLPVASDGIV